MDIQRVRALADLAAQGNEFGALHIVLSDFNLEDIHLEWCRDAGGKGSTAWTETDEKIYQAMKSATLEEREAAMDIVTGRPAIDPEVV